MNELYANGFCDGDWRNEGNGLVVVHGLVILHEVIVVRVQFQELRWYS